MDINSDSDDEEVQKTTVPARRKCGTPGCDLADFHLGPCKTQLVIGPRKRQTVQLAEVEAEAEAEAEVVEVVEAEAEVDAAGKASGKARRQAEAEGLTLQRAPSNKTGYMCVHRKKGGQPYWAKAARAGKLEYLGTFSTAEEAALAVARFHAQFDAASSATPAATSPATSSHPKAAKRPAPPPEPPREQARKATATHPQQAMPAAAAVVPAASPAEAEQAVPPPTSSPAETLLQKVGRIKAALQLDSALLLVDAIKAANELMGIAPAAGTTYPSQCDTLLAAIGV